MSSEPFANSAAVSSAAAASHSALSELPRQSSEEPTACSPLRRKDSNARAAADLVSLVERVDHVQARRQRPLAPDLEVMTRAEIDHGVARGVIAIRDAGPVGKDEGLAQSRAEEEVGAEARARPQVRDAARSRHAPFVIEVDVVVQDVGVVGRGEVELRRLDLLALRRLERQIGVGGEVLDRVVTGEFHTAYRSVAIVERGENDRRAELPLVDQVLRLLVEGVDPERQGVAQKLLL